MKRFKQILSLMLVLTTIFSLAPAGAHLAMAAQDGEAAAGEGNVAVGHSNYTGAFDLTENGNLDWLLVKTEIVSKAAAPWTEDGPVPEPVGLIKLEKVGDATKFGDAGDGGYIPHSWSDGVPVRSATGEPLWAIFHGYTGELAEDAGWSFTVPAAPYTQVVKFVASIDWNASGEIFMYVNGGAEPVYDTAWESGDSEQNRRLYTVTLAPDTSLKVVGLLRHASSTISSLSVRSIALSTYPAEEGVDYTDLLSATFEEAKTWYKEDGSSFMKLLRGAMEKSRAALEREDLTNGEAYELWYILNAALKAVMGMNFANGSDPSAQASFGWEGDKDAPIAWIDGTYKLRDNGNKTITFGVADLEPKSVSWYNAEGYLPCFVSEYSKLSMDYKVENFADLVIIDGNRFEVAYSRMTVTNNNDVNRLLPEVSSDLIPLNDAAKEAKYIQPGETVVRDYCIGADRFGGSYPYPADEVLAAQGSFDEHYRHMKDYWNNRLENIVDIKSVPGEYSELINAYKAGYIYTLIIADDYQLHVGENGYDRVFDHDVIGMLATLIESGHTEHFADYAQHILMNIQYPDAAWKFSWPFALYLQKTGDYDTIEEYWGEISGVDGIKANTHKIAAERVVYDEAILDEDGKPARIMKLTNAIDSNGYWVIDNWAALFGLTTYSYLCEKLFEKTGEEEYKTELDWASAEYDSLLKGTEAVLAHTMEEYDFQYIPISMEVPNELSARKNLKDGNWAAHYMFGRWNWDGYLFGADQDSWLLEMTDQTYDYIINAKSAVFDTPYTMGGYPGYSSGYNAGYYSAALTGEKWRDSGIQAYLWMINNTMSSPYGWWESINDPKDSSLWDRNCAGSGGGSCQHMWGQSVISKVLIDSFLAEKSDGTIIAGLGLPAEFNADGETVEISNYICNSGKRIGFIMTTEGNSITFTLTGDKLDSDVSLELIALVDNIESVSGGLAYDSAAGTVLIPAGTASVTVITSPGPADVIVTSTIGTIVAGCAANLPADVSFSGEAFGFELGLYNPDGELLSAIDVSADGRYVFRLEASDAVAGTYLIKASGAGEGVSINCVEQPVDLWKPIAAFDGGTVSVAFASEVSFVESKKSLRLDGAVIDNARASASGQVITVTDVAAAEGQTLVMSGVKYTRLFPSYCFTFSVSVPQDA